MTVLTAAITPEHYTCWLNADLLQSDWARLRLPRPLRNVWQSRFPELADAVTAELIAMGRAALDDEFRLGTLRDQLDYGAMYADDEFARYGYGYGYGCEPEQIAAIKAWAQAWANRLTLEVAQDEPWTDED
jgi:hypothetical protein